MILSTVAANLATTGCALLLLRRGPSSRLRLLTLTVGLMSLAQTAACLHSNAIWAGGSTYVSQAHEPLVACLSLLSIYLLGVEIWDRNLTDRKLRLLEHDLPTTPVVESRQKVLNVINKPKAVDVRTRKASNDKLANSASTMPPTSEFVPALELTRFYIGRTCRPVDASAIHPCTADILSLAFTLGRSVRPGVEDRPLPEASVRNIGAQNSAPTSTALKNEEGADDDN